MRWSSALCQCPTCLQAKQTTVSAALHSSRKVTQPCHGLSVDFSFSSVTSKNSKRRVDCKDVNGKTFWILIIDHFTGMRHGNAQISKAAPFQSLAHFLAQNSPACSDKCVHLHPGDELFHHPEGNNLFAKNECAILPTGVNAWPRQMQPSNSGHHCLHSSPLQH